MTFKSLLDITQISSQIVIKTYSYCLSLFIVILHTLLNELKLLKKPKKNYKFFFLVLSCSILRNSTKNRQNFSELYILQHHDLKSKCFQQLHLWTVLQSNLSWYRHEPSRSRYMCCLIYHLDMVCEISEKLFSDTFKVL